MTFARRGPYRKVYARRGPDAELEDNIPMSVEKPPKVTEIPSKPRKLCPHGGFYENDVPMCGECFRQPNSGLSPDQAFAAFLSSIRDVCKRVVWKSNHRDFRNMSRDEKVRFAFDTITSPKNLLKLLDKKTKNPYGLAYTMADRRLLDLYRSREFRDLMQRNSREIPVSQINLPRYSEDDKLAGSSSSDKLDWLSGEAAALSVIERDSPDEYYYGYEKQGRQGAHKRFETLMALDTALNESESVRNFPGVKLLWSRENISRLVDLAREAMEKLPKVPFDHSVLISLRSNAYGLRMDRQRGWDWRALAKWASDSQGKNVTEKQVRYAFLKGTETVRGHILKHLTPVLGEIVKETQRRGSIKNLNAA